MTDQTSAVTMAPAQKGDAMDSVTPDQLAEARRRWGLDAPETMTAKMIVAGKEASDKEVRKGVRMAHSIGTPGDVARALLDTPVREEWVRDLRQMSPKSEAVSWLYLTWKEPPFQPDKRRLVVYDCIPEAHIHPELRMYLAGTPYWELPQAERAGRAAIVSATQWEMYRRFRVHAKPFWIIQGKDGGTPASYSEVERKWLRLMHQPDSPPTLGALPFAPWDNRVKHRILERDRLTKFEGQIARLRERGNPETIAAELDAAEKEQRRAFWKWWTEQHQESADMWKWYIGHSEVTHRLRQETRDEFLAAAMAEERFIETGRV